MKPHKQLQPTVFAIFGGSGDLTWRKLVPSLFDLYEDLSMPLNFSIIALDRIKLNDKELHKRFRDGIEKFSRKGKVNDKVWSKFTRHIYYRQGDFTKSGIYTILKEQIISLEKEWNTKAHLIFYMATPPVMFGEIPKLLALRDMVQNHLMQLLCLVAMEPMVSFDADEIRNKKVDVLHAVRPIPKNLADQFVVRGQYGRGSAGGKKVCGYRQESGVSPDSLTETFVALKVFVDNWRWQDVPFYLRTGKRLPRQTSEVTIQFRAVPHKSFPPEAILDWQSSSLIMSIQPDEGIILRFQAKQPGTRLLLKPVTMQFNYQESFSLPIPDAYETLLWDVMKNDATLFMRADQVEAAWQIIMPVLDTWMKKHPVDFPNYAAGTWGPQEVDGLFKEGHHWPSPMEFSEKK